MAATPAREITRKASNLLGRDQQLAQSIFDGFTKTYGTGNKRE